MPVVTRSSEVTLRVLERRSNRPVAEVPTWLGLEWTANLRRTGSGMLTVLMDDLPRDAIPFITSGNAAIYATREWWRPKPSGGSVLVRDEFWGRVGAFEVEADKGHLARLSFNDNLAYLTDRVVDCDGIARVDPGPVSAVAYIRQLLNRDLLAPTDGARALDVPAVLSGPAGGGGTVDLPVRWKMLSDAVERACYLGDVGVRAPVNASGQIAFEAFPVVDRTLGAADAVVLSQENTGSLLRVGRDWRAVKNRAIVLGAGVGAARAVTRRTDDPSRLSVGLRETVIDARHLSATDEYQARGDAELDERLAPGVVLEAHDADEPFDIRVGDRVTATEYFRTDSVSPDLGPEDVLCVSRTVRLAPGQRDLVRVELGSEPLMLAAYLRGMAEEGSDSRLE